MAIKLTAAGFKDPKVEKGLDDAVDLVKMEDVAGEHDAKVPSKIPMQSGKPTQRGGYVFMDVTWEPDDVKVSGQSLMNAIESHVKNQISHRQFVDFGITGYVQFEEIDPKAGVATVYFKAKPGSGGAVQEVKSTSKE